MAKLDPYLLVLGMGKCDDIGKGWDVFIRPDTQVFRADTPFWSYTRGFEECQTWSARDDTAN